MPAYGALTLLGKKNKFLGCLVRLGVYIPFSKSLPTIHTQKSGDILIERAFYCFFICSVVIHWSVENDVASNFN